MAVPAVRAISPVSPVGASVRSRSAAASMAAAGSPARPDCGRSGCACNSDDCRPGCGDRGNGYRMALRVIDRLARGEGPGHGLIARGQASCVSGRCDGGDDALVIELHCAHGLHRRALSTDRLNDEGVGSLRQIARNLRGHVGVARVVRLHGRQDLGVGIDDDLHGRVGQKAGRRDGDRGARGLGAHIEPEIDSEIGAALIAAEEAAGRHGHGSGRCIGRRGELGCGNDRVESRRGGRGNISRRGARGGTRRVTWVCDGSFA